MPMGRPRKPLDEQQVESLISSGLNKTKIAKLLKVDRHTLTAFIKRKGLNGLCEKSHLSTDEIDAITKKAKTELPSFGERMMLGYFRASGVKVSRAKVRASIHRVDPDGVALRREQAAKRIKRRIYWSPYPHYMWHIDGNHKLIRWHMIIHIAIDGFSRACIYMHCSDNNRAQTVL